MSTGKTFPGLQLWVLLRETMDAAGEGMQLASSRVSFFRAFLRPSSTFGPEAGTSYLLGTSIIQKCFLAFLFWGKIYYTHVYECFACIYVNVIHACNA